jgi:hypothetical protein
VAADSLKPLAPATQPCDPPGRLVLGQRGSMSLDDVTDYCTRFARGSGSLALHLCQALAHLPHLPGSERQKVDRLSCWVECRVQGLQVPFLSTEASCQVRCSPWRAPRTATRSCSPAGCPQTNRQEPREQSRTRLTGRRAGSRPLLPALQGAPSGAVPPACAALRAALSPLAFAHDLSRPEGPRQVRTASQS